MNARERVKAALNFSEPDRIPRDLWALPYMSLFHQKEVDALLERWKMDIDRPEISPGTGENEMERLKRTGLYTDEWGSIWRVGEPGVIGEVQEPVLEGWDGLGAFEAPVAEIERLDVDDINAQCEWGKDNSRKNIETVFEAWESVSG
ncbi:MAG: hypothetical protein ACOCR1_00050 [Planctomycetota bacterium]